MHLPKKWICGSIGLCLLGGCALWQEANAPLVPAGGVQEAQVQLVAQKPAADCVFKGAVLGDTNPDVSGWPKSIVDLNETIRQGLVSSAQQMGGNTVWVRTQSWQNPTVDTDYSQTFYINNVEYGALVYQCPN